MKNQSIPTQPLSSGGVLHTPPYACKDRIISWAGQPIAKAYYGEEAEANVLVSLGNSHAALVEALEMIVRLGGTSAETAIAARALAAAKEATT